MARNKEPLYQDPYGLAPKGWGKPPNQGGALMAWVFGIAIGLPVFGAIVGGLGGTPAEPSKAAKAVGAPARIDSEGEATPKRTIVRLGGDRFAKLGGAKIIFCDTIADLYDAHYDDRIGIKGNRSVFLQGKCFLKTLEFEYKYIDRALFYGPSSIRFTGGHRLEHRSKAWVMEQSIRKVSYNEYEITPDRCAVWHGLSGCADGGDR